MCRKTIRAVSLLEERKTHNNAAIPSTPGERERQRQKGKNCEGKSKKYKSVVSDDLYLNEYNNHS